MIDKWDFIDNFNDECVSFIIGIENNISINNYKSIFVNVKNNISIYIVEVPNEIAPSIQGFAKPPA